MLWIRASHRPEQCRDRQGRRRDREARSLGETAQGQLQEQHAADVHAGEGGGQRAVDQGPVDHDVDVVEPVAQDRDAGRDGDDRERDAEQHGPSTLRLALSSATRRSWRRRQRPSPRRWRRRTRPTSAAGARRPWPASKRRRIDGCGEHQPEPHERPAQGGDRLEQAELAADADRVGDRVERRVQPVLGAGVADEDERRARQRDDTPPATSDGRQTGRPGTASGQRR